MSDDSVKRLSIDQMEIENREIPRNLFVIFLCRGLVQRTSASVIPATIVISWIDEEMVK